MTDQQPNATDDWTGGAISRRGLLAAGATGLALPTLAGCVTISREGSETTVTRSVRAEPLETVTIANDVGDVIVRAGDGESVSIRAKKHASGDVSLAELAVDASVAGEHLEIATRFPDTDVFGSGWIDLTVELPPHVALGSVDAIAGDVTVVDVSGDPTVSTENGDVTVRRVDGDVQSDVTNGDVTVDHADGLVTARTLHGDIEVREPRDLGDLVVTDGDLTADVRGVASDSVVETTDGDILVRLHPDLDLHVEARTRNGEISGLEVLDQVEIATETALEGAIGAASTTLELRATNGDITIRRGT